MRRALVLLLVLCFALSAQAGLLLDEGKGAAIDIEADKGIEWLRDKNLYKATGNVVVKRGTVELRADEVFASYADVAGQPEISQLAANGRVQLISPTGKATGNQALYDVAKGYLKLTGETVTLQSKGDTLVAKKQLEYWQDQRLAVVQGGAEIRRGKNVLRADKIWARFTEDKRGEIALTSMEARGNVTIITPNDVVRSDNADYDVTNNLVTLVGAVRLTRGETQLNGERAEVNLQSGQARLLGSTQRVRGRFVPNQRNTP